MTKVFLEIRIFEYFGYLRLGSNEFLALIPNQPALRRVKCNPEKLYAKKLLLRWSRDQCLARRETRLRFSVELGFRTGLWLGYDLRYWLGLGLGSGIRAQGL